MSAAIPVEKQHPRTSDTARRLVDTGFKGKALALAAFVIFAATILNTFFGDRGVLSLMKSRQEYEALAQEVDLLQAENSRLSDEIQALRSDPLVVEKKAREVLGMAKEGEIVVHIRYPGLR